MKKQIKTMSYCYTPIRAVNIKKIEKIPNANGGAEIAVYTLLKGI